MTNPINWTLGRLFDAMREIKTRAVAADNEIGANNLRVNDLWQTAQRIGDRQAIAALEKWGARQVAIVQKHQQFAARFRTTSATLRSWLDRVGIAVPSDLSGPAIVIVPIVVVGAVIVALQYVRSVEIANQTQRAGLEQNAEVLALLRSGRVSAKDAAAMMDRNLMLANQQTPDLFSIGQLGQMLVPLALIAGAVILLPPLLGALPKGRR